MNVPIWIFIGFQRGDRQDSQKLNNDNSSRLPTVSAQCVIPIEKNPDGGIMLIYDDDDYSQSYAQIKEAFRVLTKYDILQPCISLDKIRFSNIRVDDVGYTFYVVDISSHQNYTAFQPIKAEFKFDGVGPNDISGYVLVLTNKLVSISSPGQQHFNLI